MNMEMVFYREGNRRYIVNENLLDDSVKDGTFKKYLEEGSEAILPANPGKNSCKHLEQFLNEITMFALFVLLEKKSV